MRRLATLALLVLAAAAGPAGAVEVGRDTSPGTIVTTDKTPGDETTTEQPERDDNGKWFMYQLVLWSPDTGFCVQRRWTRDQAYAERQNRTGFAIRFDRTSGAPRLECPKNAVAAPPNLRQIAEAAWQEVKNLPVPTLAIEPDHAITGKKVYLQIAGERSWSETVDNPIGDDITITATSDYAIDWGDQRQAPTTTTSQGGPWPSGDVTHTYTDAAQARTITVTQRWTATWRAGQATGNLTDLRTQAQPLTFEVRQLQAVRDR